MSQTIEAVFDGLVFRPLEPVELEPHARVRLTVTPSGFSPEALAAALAEQIATPAADNADPDPLADLDRYIYENYVNSDFNRPR